MMWGLGGFGFLWMALFWVGIVLIIAWAVRRPEEGRPRSGSRAIDILEERFARGDITVEEFDLRRRELVG